MDEQIIKYCQGELEKEEKDRLLKQAYQDASLKSRIIEYQQLHSLLNLQKDSADIELGKAKYKQFKQLISQQRRRFLFRRWGQYAAILTIAILSSWLLAFYYYTQPIHSNLISMRQELYVPPDNVLN